LGAKFTDAYGRFIPMLAKRLHYLLRPVLNHPEEKKSSGTSSAVNKDRSRGLGHLLQHPATLVLLGALLLLLLASPDQSLMALDEGIYAQQARWMLARGDWITVGWWNNPEFDHAIGWPWLVALSLQWFGQTEWAVRLPSMVASWVAVMLTWRLGARLLPGAGIWGAAILAIMPVWMQASKLGIPQVLFASLGLATIWALLKAEEMPHQRGLWGGLVGLLLNVCFLLQGTLVLLPMLALLPYLIGERRRHHHLTNKGLYWGLGLGALPAGVWLGCSIARHGWLSVQPVLQQPFGNLQELFVGSVAQPLTGTTTVFFYLWHVPAVTFPWSLLAVIGTVLVWRHALVHRLTLWLGYPLTYLGWLSLAPPASDYAALALYPFVALLAGVGLNYLTRLFCSPRRRHHRVAEGFGWALGVLAILLLSAGGALVITPGELVPAEIKLLGWLAIATGLGWLVPWQMTVNRIALSANGRVAAKVGALWSAGWLLGPVFAIATLFLTGLWGNYSPDLKTALQTPPIDPVLEHHSIHFIQPGKAPEDILLSFYTPHLGQRYSYWQDLAAGDYAWGNSQVLPLPDDSYEVIGEINGWQLVKRGGE
jgi:4-amino-4-deoxy-L-arabinose transferase-like glycosyltransferase